MGAPPQALVAARTFPHFDAFRRGERKRTPAEWLKADWSMSKPRAGPSFGINMAKPETARVGSGISGREPRLGFCMEHENLDHHAKGAASLEQLSHEITKLQAIEQPSFTRTQSLHQARSLCQCFKQAGIYGAPTAGCGLVIPGANSPVVT